MRTNAVILSALVALCALVLSSLLGSSDLASPPAEADKPPATVEAPAAADSSMLVSFTPDPATSDARGIRATVTVPTESSPDTTAVEVATPTAIADVPVTIVPAAAPAVPAAEASPVPVDDEPATEVAAPTGPDHSLFLPAPISAMTSGDAAAPAAPITSVGPSTDMAEVAVSGSGAMFPAELGTDIDFSTDMVGLPIDTPAAG